jgi:signal transduction histidine kinase
VLGVESRGIEGKKLLETMPDAREDGFFQILNNILETNEPFGKEWYSENRKKWFLLFGTKLHDGVTITISDITRSKEAAQELMKAEKLAVAGRIARTIAHEVRNPLTNINLAVEQLKDELDALRDENVLYLDIVKRNSDRINQLITELMNSSKPAEMKVVRCSVNQLLDDTLNWAVDRMRLKSIMLKKEYCTDSLFIKADIEKLKTALINIIINAVEAMKEGEGVLTIRSFAINNKCRIEIEDNGQGISKESLEKLFDPFFSKKEKGMGLGLTATQNIILTHGGTIEVRSDLGKGTCFTLTFNRSEV